MPNSLSIKINFFFSVPGCLALLILDAVERIIFAFSNTCSLYFKPISLPLLFFSRFIIAGAELSMLSHGVSILFSNFMNKKKADVRNFLQCLFLLELQSPTTSIRRLLHIHISFFQYSGAEANDSQRNC